MQTSNRLTFRPSLAPSPAVQARIAHLVAKLEKLSPRVLGCHVTLDAPHQHHLHGAHYTVRIEIHVPGGTLVVNRDPAQRKDREDLYAAISDAFDDAARLVVKDRERRRQQTA